MRYNYITKEQSGRTYSGLIAQEVEELLRELNQNFSGVVCPENDNAHYAIRYAEFVVPIINAIQEQQQTIQTIQIENKNLKKELNKYHELEQRLILLENKK